MKLGKNGLKTGRLPIIRYGGGATDGRAWTSPVLLKVLMSCLVWWVPNMLNTGAVFLEMFEILILFLKCVLVVFIVFAVGLFMGNIKLGFWSFI